MVSYYGPARPPNEKSITDVPVKPHLRGATYKISRDIERQFKHSEGFQVHLHRVAQDPALRCPQCTDSITGRVILSNCTVCQGTGYTLGYQFQGTYWAKADINPVIDLATAWGNTVNQGIQKTSFAIPRAPKLHDKDILNIHGTDQVYKIIDQEAQLLAVQGSLVMQIAMASLLPPGSPEAKTLNIGTP